MELILEDSTVEITVDQTIEFARKKLTSNFIPGEKAKYSDTNFQLLGKIIERIENKELHEVYKERILNTLNLKNTWLYKKSEPIDNTTKTVAEFYGKGSILRLHQEYAE